MHVSVGMHDARQLRNALGRFATGVTIVTARARDGGNLGLTVNSFAALSLDPALVLWSLNHHSPSSMRFREAGHFAVNVLRAAQAGLSHRFATRGGERFAGIDFDEGLGGAPLLRGMLATFECETSSVTEGGDHLLFVGRVLRLAYGDGDPLIFNAGKYCTARELPAADALEDLRNVWGPPG
jgi:3-hydroxy-9,10-secoandrosta-1,3,5(10)-triene-9,17-dione monooxygenase reductase component